MRPLLRAAVLSFGLVALHAETASADAGAPSRKSPRHRTCCALASDLPLHLGAAHVPVAMGIVIAPGALGPHSYAGDYASREWNGVIYTRRGGFIDTGHTREYADLTAHLAVSLAPLLARGEGVLRLDERDGELSVQITRRVPEAELASTAARIAQRIAFQISVWVEITQFYGHTVMRGAEEHFSAFTPEDLYSNLLGAHLGAGAVASALPYDQAMTSLLTDALSKLEAVPSSETRRVLTALAGRWWRAHTAWPSPSIPILRSFDLGPRVRPLLAPSDVVPPAEPFVLDVPESDENGAPLSAMYRLSIVPNLSTIPSFARAGAPAVLTADELPDLVALVRRSVEAGEDAPGVPSIGTRAGADVAADDGNEHAGPLAHYLIGLRMLDLKVAGGVSAPPSGATAKGIFGGALIGIRGDTRGGDFDVVRLDVGYTAERGLVSGFALFRSDAVYFCHDRETGALRAPLLSLLGPCARGEWLGLGGSVAEAFHDGRTGRTALRPVSLYGVLDVLGNGQSPSYDGLRLLLRGGGAVEHVWTAAEGGVTIPRAGGNAVVLARTPGRHLEVYGGAGYRVDPTTPRDAGFESSLSLRWYFLLGGKGAAKPVDAVDPWGVASLGVEGGYSFWTRPRHSFPDVAAPFVSAERSGTWQLLVTATVGFEGLTF